MEIMLHSLGYGNINNTRIVIVTLAAVDTAGGEHFVRVEWPAIDVPELATLFRKAIEQVGGDLALQIDCANAKLTAQPAVATLETRIDVAKDVTLRTAVEARKQELLAAQAATDVAAEVAREPA